VRVVPLDLAEANAFVARLHRHHEPTVGHRWSIGLVEGRALVGVAIVGRPVGRKTDQRMVAEALRVCTDGSDNACSMLYGAVARAAKAMGFWKVQTFILASEPGTSLKAAGWLREGDTPGRSWSVPSRAREDAHPLGPRVRWVRVLNDQFDGELVAPPGDPSAQMVLQ
jgi:hypothetical protein